MSAEQELSNRLMLKARDVMDRSRVFDPGLQTAAVNTLGIRRIMFSVDNLDIVLARLLAGGADLIGDVTQYGDTYRLCYVRGPEGIMVALAEPLG